jgi:hypothetical protein
LGGRPKREAWKRVISGRKTEERSMGEREKWVGEKNNKKRKVVVSVFIIREKYESPP